MRASGSWVLDTVKASCNSMMVRHMKEIGTLAMRRDMANSQTQQGRRTKENGLIICVTAREFQFIRTEESTRANGSKMHSVEWVWNSGKMKISKELTKMGKRMALDGTSGKTMHSTRVTGLRAKSMALAPTDGQMEESSQVNGSTVKQEVSVCTLGPMVEGTKASSLEIRGRGTEFT